MMGRVQSIQSNVTNAKSSYVHHEATLDLALGGAVTHVLAVPLSLLKECAAGLQVGHRSRSVVSKDASKFVCSFTKFYRSLQ